VPTPPPRQRVLQLRELDLQLRLRRARPPGEDVHDQLGAIDDAHADVAHEVAGLRGREVHVRDRERGTGGGHGTAQLLDLALADVGRRDGLGQALRDPRRDADVGGLGQAGQLVERLALAVPAVDAAEEHGDLGALGRHRRHPPHGRADLETS
jgi:hypothetical protein